MEKDQSKQSVRGAKIFWRWALGALLFLVLFKAPLGLAIGIGLFMALVLWSFLAIISFFRGL